MTPLRRTASLVPVSDVRERPIDIDDGAQLWTVSSGPIDGQPVVLCHGGPGLWDNFGPVAALLDSIFHVHRYDQRGCGRSTGPDDYRLARAVADLDSLRGSLGHERWTVFGHSWGATLVFAYATTHPDRVQKVVYCGGTGPGSEWRDPCRTESAKRLTSEQRDRLDALEGRERSWAEEVEFRMLSWLPDFADPAAADSHLRAEASVRYAINWAANKELGADRTDPYALADQVTAPMLIVHGEQDPRPLSNVGRLLDVVPNATLAAIPGAGHAPWFEKPAVFSDQLHAFLRTG